MQKIIISIACSVGLHVLLLLYWQNQQLQHSHQQAQLNNQSSGLSEPVRIVLRPGSQRPTLSDQPPLQTETNTPEQITAPDPAVLAADTTTATDEIDVAAQPGAAVQATESAVAPAPNNSMQIPELARPDVLLTLPSKPDSSTPIALPDRFSLRQQIQQYSPQTEDVFNQAEACQRVRAMRGMPVNCQPERYAAIVEEAAPSLSTRTEQRLANTLDGPAAVSRAGDFDASDTGNRVEANRNLVGDQLQANQLRNSVMNQP
jgi:hypothetical protein